MPSAVSLREDYSVEELRALARRSKTVNQSRRLLSLAAVRDGMDRGAAAKVGGMDRQTLRDWVHRFNALGPEGLIDNWTQGPKPRLSAEQLAEVAQIVDAGPDREKDGVVRWRRIDLILAPGDIVVMDNLRSHKGHAIRAAIRAAKAKLFFLPAYSPDLNPIEQAFAKMKTFCARPSPEPSMTPGEPSGPARLLHPNRMRKLLHQCRIRFSLTRSRSNDCSRPRRVGRGQGSRLPFPRCQ